MGEQVIRLAVRKGKKQDRTGSQGEAWQQVSTKAKASVGLPEQACSLPGPTNHRTEVRTK